MTYGSSCNVEKTKTVVKECIKTSDIKSHASGELIFSLPDSERSSFGDLFKALEKQKNELDISNLGLSITTMEDVFLRYAILYLPF